MRAGKGTVIKALPKLSKAVSIEKKLKKEEKTNETDYKEAVKTIKELYRNFHCLRHTHATMLLADGEPLIEVSRRLGHAKPSITLDLYWHSIPGHDQATAKRVGTIFQLQEETK